MDFIVTSLCVFNPILGLGLLYSHIENGFYCHIENGLLSALGIQLAMYNFTSSWFMHVPR